MQFIKMFDIYLHFTDLYYLHLLNMLPLLFKPVMVRKNKSGTSWKPSKKEVAEGFIMHVKVNYYCDSYILCKSNLINFYRILVI